MTNSHTFERIDRVCFTGHRNIDPRHAPIVPALLEQILRTLTKHGSTQFFAGGALGFDTLAAITVLKLKEELPHIKLNLILPCKNQTKMWSENDRSVYDAILAQADSVEYVSDSYTSLCMHERNRRLVDNTEICISYCIHNGGGSAYTIAYALKNEKSVISLADFL